MNTPEGAVSVVNPQGTEETGADRPAAPIRVRPRLGAPRRGAVINSSKTSLAVPVPESCEEQERLKAIRASGSAGDGFFSERT